MTKDHPIRISPNPNRVRVRLGDKVVADTTRALTLLEASYPGVQYVPREDADMSLLVGPHRVLDAAAVGGENAVWTYEQPFPEVARIGGYLAFYPNKVEISEERGG